MKLYYINNFKKDRSTVIGLFTESNWSGEGNFGGWYGAEFYNNTDLLAYCEVENVGLKTQCIIGEVMICTEHHDKIQIGSVYQQETIEADNDVEAIQLFLEKIKGYRRV